MSIPTEGVARQHCDDLARQAQRLRAALEDEDWKRCQTILKSISEDLGDLRDFLAWWPDRDAG